MARFLALALDKACVVILAMAAGALLGVAHLIHWDTAAAAGTVAGFAISFLYPIVFEWFAAGRTPGKMALNLQVMDQQGLRLRFSQVVVRNLLRAVDALPAFYLVGGLSGLLTARAQRLGDVAAGTIVVRHRRHEPPDLTRLMPDKFNSMKACPYLAARLKQRIAPAEASIALRAILRRDRLDDEARLSLFRELRTRIERHVAFPEAATAGLSDEQFIRNVVDMLYSAPSAAPAAAERAS